MSGDKEPVKMLEPKHKKLRLGRIVKGLGLLASGLAIGLGTTYIQERIETGKNKAVAERLIKNGFLAPARAHETGQILKVSNGGSSVTVACSPTLKDDFVFGHRYAKFPPSTSNSTDPTPKIDILSVDPRTDKSPADRIAEQISNVDYPVADPEQVRIFVQATLPLLCSFGNTSSTATK